MSATFVGLLDAAAVTSATVGGCREVNSSVVRRVVDSFVVAVSAVVIASAVPAKPLKALSSGSASSLGYPRVVTPTRGESADPIFHAHPQRDGLQLG